MFALFNKKEDHYKLYSPCDGEMIPIENVNDDMFSKKMLGDGCAFIPKDGMIYSPVSGEIIATFPTKHAIGIRGKSGVEILIHVGLDTVNLNGTGFLQYVTQNQTVKAGKALMYADIDLIKRKGIDTIIMMVITNSEKYCLTGNREKRIVSKKELLFEIKGI